MAASTKNAPKAKEARPRGAAGSAAPRLKVVRAASAKPAAKPAAKKQASKKPAAKKPPKLSPKLSQATIVKALKTVYDPEIPVDVYELGLIYRVEIKPQGKIEIDMTLTAPGCPVAEYMPIWVEEAVRPLPGVRDVQVQMVFEPPWDMSRMSEEARVALNMF